jgi:hypothetical protein
LCAALPFFGSVIDWEPIAKPFSGAVLRANKQIFKEGCEGNRNGRSAYGTIL